jgi:hypothetical protein
VSTFATEMLNEEGKEMKLEVKTMKKVLKVLIKMASNPIG